MIQVPDRIGVMLDSSELYSLCANDCFMPKFNNN